MLKTRNVTDPLWQCLCPAWNTTVTSSVLRTARQQYTTHKSNEKTQHVSRRKIRAAFQSTRSYQTSRTVRPDTGLKARRVSLHEEPDEDLSTESLYQRLNSLAIDGDTTGCQRVAEHLLRERGEPPSTYMYNALILANIDAVSGAAWRVRNLLGEMEQEGHAPDATTYHSVLKVLAVHPDHLLRTDVLARMRDNWITITADGQHDVTTGWLREGCLEVAMDVLDKMRHDGVRIEPWLLDMFVYSFCDAGEIEAAYQIMQDRHDSGQLNTSRALWLYFLDAAADARHLAGVELAWRVKVTLGELQASSGVCENALATASVHGSPALATDVFTHFTKRGDLSTTMHYQLLIDAYMNSDPPDFRRALNVLSVMALEKFQPGTLQTRSLYQYLRDSKLTVDALKAVHELQQQGRIVPIATINLLVECCCWQDNLDGAIAIYKQIPSLLSNNPVDRTGADLETFQLLLRKCQESQPPNTEQAVSLFSDMLATRVKPDATIYNGLIKIYALAAERAAAHAVNGEDHVVETCEALAARALIHYNDAKDSGIVVDADAINDLVVALAAAGDSQWFDLARSYTALNEHSSKILKARLSRWSPQQDLYRAYDEDDTGDSGWVNSTVQASAI